MGFDKAMVDRLLEKARTNNEAQNVTGMLCFDGEHFVQILEGDIENVERLYNQICQDTRHDNIKQIYSGEITERNFNDWSMGYQFISPMSGEILEQAWTETDALLETSGKIETRGVTFFKHLKKTQLTQTPKNWD